MFDTWMDYPWFLDTHRYESQELLMTSLPDAVIGPAEDYAERIAQRRAEREKEILTD